jgi:transposase-like protein
VLRWQKQCNEEEKKAGELGDQYVFVALDADSKLVPLYRVGKRTTETTLSFIKDLQARINTRFQLSTDSFKPYADAVDRVFGEDIDYGQAYGIRHVGTGNCNFSRRTKISWNIYRSVECDKSFNWYLLLQTHCRQCFAGQEDGADKIIPIFFIV